MWGIVGLSAQEKRIARLETDLMKRKDRIARLRRRVPAREIADFQLMSSAGRPVSLSKLFGTKRELMLIHNMGAACSYCTLWADGFNGALPHLESRVAFAVESPDAPAAQKRFASSRKWRFPLVSSRGTGFRRETGFETRGGDPIPGVSIFVRKGRKIYQVSRAQFGPGDSYCGVWDLFDLLPKGADGWGPKFRY